MVLYHGTNIRDGESILKDGFIFPIAFLRLREELRKRQVSEENISSMFQEIGSILPVGFRDSNRPEILNHVKDYCLSHGLDFKLRFRPDLTLFAWDAMIGNRAGIYFAEGEEGYYTARSKGLHKCLSISQEKRWNCPEGIVFEANFPSSPDTTIFCRPIPVSDLTRAHLFYENYETVQRVLALATRARIPLSAELYLIDPFDELEHLHFPNQLK